jgi:hypothetical protein
MLRQGDWLFFIDCDSPGIPGNWMLRAINLRTYAEKILVQAKISDQKLIYNFSSDGKQVAVVVGEQANTNNCPGQFDSVLLVIQIDSGKQQELDRACFDQDYEWLATGILGDDLIASRSTANGSYSSEIVAFNLTDGSSRSIAGSLTDNPNPAVQQPGPVYGWFAAQPPWIALATRPDWTTLLYNLKTKSFVPVSCTVCSGILGPKTNGHWIYFEQWQSGSDPNPKVAAYDLDQQAGRVLAVPGENERVDELSINDNMAVWVRTLNADQAASTSVIEWTDLQ